MENVIRTLPLVATAVLAFLLGCKVDSRPPATRPATAIVMPPADHPLYAEITYGRAILDATRDSLPQHVGNALRCTSCHLDGGATEVLGWQGVYAKFPQFRSRNAAIQVIEDRINDCFERSMDGRRMPVDTAPMKAIVAYLAWVSKDVPVTGGIAGGRITAPFDGLQGDTTAGADFFRTECARCHGAEGQGTVAGPPVWGPGSYNIGAGLARPRTAAAFILANMPRDRAGTLTAQQALDMASYIDSRPRPDFAGKEQDWPRGGAPDDTPYRTRSSQ